MEEPVSDEALMDQVRSGSKDAFRELMTRWQRSLYGLFHLMGVDRCAAEDCVQETFLRVFSYRDRYRDLGSSFRAFLFRVGRNVAVDSFRKAERVGRVISLESDPPAEDSSALWSERFDCEWALRSLPERLRVVVVLNIYEGLNYRETAEILAVPVGTVKSRMYHALRRLREVLRAEAQL